MNILPYTAKGTWQMSLSILRCLDDLGSPGGPNVIAQILLKRRQEGKDQRAVIANAEVGVLCFEDGGSDHKPRNAGGPSIR